MASLRLGCQEPTFEVVGDYACSLADDVVEMFESYGRDYYGSQRYEMRLFYARTETGDYASRIICITKPRQNGKSFAARDYAIDQAAVSGKKVLYSAHNTKTVADMFDEIKKFIKSDETLASSVTKCTESIGFWSLDFDNGGIIDFRTRTNSGGRGGTYDVIIMDEAQEITEAHLNAVLPSASAASELVDGEGGPQVIYLGTVPDDTCMGTVFKRFHDNAHGGRLKNAWWVEWGVQAQSLDEIDITDRDLWYRVNPAMGRRISESTVANECESMSRDGFARERLGWWPPKVTNAVLDWTKWQRLRTDNAPKSKATFGVKFSVDGLDASIVAAIPCDDGTPYVEWIKDYDMEEGLAPVVSDCASLASDGATIYVDGQSNAEPFRDRMVSRGVAESQVCLVDYKTVATACSELRNAVSDEELRHFGQEHLDEAVRTSARRPIGSRGGWGFSGPYDTTMEACAIALHGMRKDTKPRRKARFNV